MPSKPMGGDVLHSRGNSPWARRESVPSDVTTVRETMQGLFELPVCTDETEFVGSLGRTAPRPIQNYRIHY